MKSKVRLSAYCIVVTAVVIVAMVVGIISSWGNDRSAFFILTATLICMMGFGLFYIPVCVETMGFCACCTSCS